MTTEEPSFHMSFKEGPFEVRDYPSLVAAGVTIIGDRNQAANEGFKLLAGYIFGANHRGEMIAVTTPFMQAKAFPAEAQASWVIRFLMPDRYALSDLPIPDDKRVTLVVLPPQQFAVHRFSGLALEADVDSKTIELREFATKRQFRASASPALARYNPPWTPWFLRRNELLLPIEGSTRP